jgi:hypothetical protein
MKPPTLTKKHFVFLAQAIADARTDCVAQQVDGDHALDVLVDRMCERLAQTNAQFHEHKFRGACNYGQVSLDFDTDVVETNA